MFGRRRHWPVKMLRFARRKYTRGRRSTRRPCPSSDNGCCTIFGPVTRADESKPARIAACCQGWTLLASPHGKHLKLKADASRTRAQVRPPLRHALIGGSKQNKEPHFRGYTLAGHPLKWKLPMVIAGVFSSLTTSPVARPRTSTCIGSSDRHLDRLGRERLLPTGG